KQSLKYSKIDQVGDTKLDTYQNNDLFFSHRRTTHESDLKESKTGRQISVIGIIK
ncbi:polyphenol oxidase family protein, partial [Alphaproteobacteria bacterium]|nr:polyphenol oxidase family protein [Alphaproteobacteria bacterium]